MKNVLTSGKGFIKRDRDIIMYPASKGREKSITAPNLEKIWSEMKFLDSNFSYRDLTTYHLLKQNKLVFNVSDSEWENYQNVSRNIQNLTLYNIENPYKYYQEITQKKIMVIGLGTIGSPLVTELSKFGFRNIVIIDGDKVESQNLTAQLNYAESDIGNFKAKVLYDRVQGIKTYLCQYITLDNIQSIMSKIKPEVVFCCADDSTGSLLKLLISNTENYNYSLFLTGYSQEELIVQYVTKNSKNVFLNYFDEQPFLAESEFISHNTGTILKGMMSSSLVFNTFLQAIYGKANDILFLNTRTNEIYTQNIKDLNLSEFERKYIFHDLEYEISKINYHLDNSLETDKTASIQKLFNFNYYTYLRFHSDTTNLKFKYLSHQINSLFLKTSNFSQKDYNFKPQIIQLEKLKSNYYKENGLLINRYYKNRYDSNKLNNILQNYTSFVSSSNFTNLYNALLNKRKQTINSISEKIKIRYGFDFFTILKDKLHASIDTTNMTKYDFLAFEFVQSPTISDEAAFEIISNSFQSDIFSHFVYDYKQKGYIDYIARPQKSSKNFTLYNPYSKTSKIIMTYHENMGGVLRLAHEIMHAYSYEVFKERLDLEKLYKIPKFFWEVFAKIGELYVSDNQKQLSLFFRKSFYQYVFCHIDYHLLSLNKTNVSIADILNIKDEFCISIGLNPDLLKYTKYNFIDYNMLYSNHFYAYDAVFSDIVAFGIFNYCKNSDYSFDQISSIFSSIKDLNIHYLIDAFNLDITELINLYSSETNKFLQNHFLEDFKLESFKEK